MKNRSTNYAGTDKGYYSGPPQVNLGLKKEYGSMKKIPSRGRVFSKG